VGKDRGVKHGLLRRRIAVASTDSLRGHRRAESVQFSRVADGQPESRRAELWEELVGSFLPQVCLYHWLESNDYGRILSDNNVYIKDKQMVCLSYRSDFEVIRNYCVSQVQEKVCAADADSYPDQ
jgi:hypothetical protein